MVNFQNNFILQFYNYKLIRHPFFLYCRSFRKRVKRPMADKVQFELEFPVKASPNMLYPFLSTPSGLSEWFCDDVNSRGEMFTFFWEGSEESAKLIAKKNDRFIRWRWMEAEEAGEKTYFEFRIEVDELTNDASLIITDFAFPNEIDEAKLLWNSQINSLLHVIGS